MEPRSTRTLCVCLTFSCINVQGLANQVCRRTYGDDDQGEDIRHGFEPERLNPDHQAIASDEGEREDDAERDDTGRAHYGDMDNPDVWKDSP